MSYDSSSFLFATPQLVPFAKLVEQPKLIEEEYRSAMNVLQKEFESLENRIACSFGSVTECRSQPKDSDDQHCSITWENAVEPYLDIHDRLSFASAVLSHLLMVAGHENIRNIVESVESIGVDLGLRMQQSQVMYTVFSKLKTSDPVKKRILDILVMDCQAEGISLKSLQDKQQFNQLSKDMVKYSNTFQSNLMNSTNEWSMILSERDVSDLPEWLRQSMLVQENKLDKILESKEVNKSVKSIEPGKSESEQIDKSDQSNQYKVTLDPAIYNPFIQTCTNSKLRQQAYEAYMTRASVPNKSVIANILKARQSLAELLGYSSHAELNLSQNKLAKTVANVDKFQEQLLGIAYPAAQKEYKALEEFVRNQISPDDDKSFSPLQWWDIPYWSERYKSHCLQFTEESLRSYFEFPQVLRGLFQFAHDLFGIDIMSHSKSDLTLKEVLWNERVQYFQVSDNETNEILGSFFLDAYSRPGYKSSGAWANTLYNRKKVVTMNSDQLSTSVRLPVAFLICNQPPTTSLMSLDEVQTLFHEFGHCLHMILTQVEYPYVAGIRNVAWDMVECPSQFLENFVLTDRVLDLITTPSNPMPKELREKIKLSNQFMAGSKLLHYVRLGMLDMELHRQDLSKIEIQKMVTVQQQQQQEEKEDMLLWNNIKSIEQQVNAKALVRPPWPNQQFLCQFDHVFVGSDYAAGYYSYNWAWALDADCFQAFEEAAKDESTWKELGRKFRNTILALGGSVPSEQVYRQFRGRDLVVEPLLKKLGLI